MVTRCLYRIRFAQHKRNAKLRGVGFIITFEEWCKVWNDSGCWEQRGRRKGQYVMARFGDKGPYSFGNVKIQLHVENIKDRKFTAEELERRSIRRQGGPYLGLKKHTAKTKALLRLAMLSTLSKYTAQDLSDRAHKVWASRRANALKKAGV